MLYLTSHLKCDESELIMLNCALKIHLKQGESTLYPERCMEKIFRRQEVTCFDYRNYFMSIYVYA